MKTETNPAHPRTLGIDIGRVIIGPGEGHQDTSFLDGGEQEAMRTPPMPGAFETIAQLVTLLRGRVWLVSKCGPKVQARSRRWLSHHHFYERTGVHRQHLRFCRKRRDKAPICRELGLEAFIDDRPDVLVPMEGIVRWRYLFGPQRRGGSRPGIVAVRDWDEVAAELLPRPSVSPSRTRGSAGAPAR